MQALARSSYNGITSAFQADDVGSTPIGRFSIPRLAARVRRKAIAGFIIMTGGGWRGGKSE